jgi:hypothetical protein
MAAKIESLLEIVEAQGKQLRSLRRKSANSSRYPKISAA